MKKKMTIGVTMDTCVRPTAKLKDEELNPCHYKYLLFDTETSGKYSGHLLKQITWFLVDGPSYKNIISRGNYFTQPDIHGPTVVKPWKSGSTFYWRHTTTKPLDEVLRLFLHDLMEADCYIGHNVQFDRYIVLSEVNSVLPPNEQQLFKLCLQEKTSICTMFGTAKHLRLPGPYGCKWPRLQELHTCLFGKPFKHAHNSVSDTRATVMCFWEACRRGWFADRDERIKASTLKKGWLT